jgi:ABC-type Fe3+ transport system permease subunit/DNA-binding beta-propeller fold protein YncE
LVVGACCALPLGWIVCQILTNPTTLQELRPDAYRARLIGRTLLYNASVAVVATLIALPSAFALGRGRGLAATLLSFVLPVSLLLPSLVFAYGWSQLLRLMWELTQDRRWLPEPGSLYDVSRCVWSLATWLYPVPAIVGALALRRMDSSVQQQALLDGAYWRVTLRQLLGPLSAAGAIVAVLAMQEFAVYEPTGISVVATETRLVFETGAIDQRVRAAGAVATSIPVLVAIGVLALFAGRAVKRLSAVDAVDPGDWPRSLDASWRARALSWLVVIVTLLVPLVGLALSLKRAFDPRLIWAELGPQVSGSMLVAGITGVVVFTMGLLAAVRPARGAMVVALITFLVGGQLIAIALIRIYNRAATSLVYESAAAVVMAYVARFGWIALAAAGATWGAPWRPLRDLAAVDGARPLAVARRVVWPLAWPTLAAAALFVAALALGEVPATTLLAPQRPQLLVPLLMTWVHMLRYDAMIEASLVIVGMVVVVGVVAVVLARVGARMMSNGKRQMSIVKRSKRARRAFHISLLTFAICHLTCLGCDEVDTPDEVWLETGIADGQVVYPRAIAYSPSDDTFFVCDRTAHVQHIDSNGKFLNGWHMPLSAQGKPVGLTVGPDGNLYVPDTHYHRVMVYSPVGKLLREWGSQGTAPGQFIYPTDVAFDSKGNVFVSEYGDNDRIQVFDPRDGKFLYQFGAFGSGDGQFSRPQSMVIDGDHLYVTDACNHRICVFKTDGSFVRNLGSAGSQPGQFRFPYGLDMDKDGDLIVCEFGNNRVQKIDKNTGSGKATWGGAGREPGRLAYPWGVAVDKRGRVIVVDAGNNRLQVFEF